MYCKCCYKLLWWEHKRIDSLFFQFSKHIAYIYMYTISWPNLSSLSAFSITIHKSQQREERQLKKNCISSNPPSASISFAVFLKIVCLIRKKIHSYFVMFLKLCSDHYCSDTIAPSNVLVQGLLFPPNLTIEIIINILCLFSIAYLTIICSKIMHSFFQTKKYTAEM